MFLLLSGCGVGYSVQTHHIEKLPEIKVPTKHKRYLIGDSIEGWADAVRMLCKAYFTGAPLPLFDFRDIRPKGAQLITVGGKAPGPEPLKECLFNLQKVFDDQVERSMYDEIFGHMLPQQRASQQTKFAAGSAVDALRRPAFGRRHCRSPALEPPPQPPRWCPNRQHPRSVAVACAHAP